MIDQPPSAPNPTAHIPDLFLRALKTGMAKGGLALGEPSPLLPWIPAVSKGPEDDGALPDLSLLDSALSVPLEQSVPPWLRLSFERTVVDGAAAPAVFSLRYISHVGFGFGNSRPW